MTHLLVVCLWLGTAAPATLANAQTPNAAAVLKQVQAFYAGTKRLTAQFGQRVTNKAYGKTNDSSGNVYLAKPGKMRWDYSDSRGKSVTKSFISNGVDLYIVERDNKQVVKKKLREDLMPVAVTFLTGAGNLASEFAASVESTTKDEIVLALTPKVPSAQYKTLRLVVATDNYRVKRSIITDAAGNTNEISFYSPDVDKPIDPKWFELAPHAVRSYRIIDADKH